MCIQSNSRNPFYCIVPPYMVAKIEAAGETKRTLFASSARTRFHDELFRKKRALLSEMGTTEMKTVLNAAYGNMVGVMAAVGRPVKKAVKTVAHRKALKGKAVKPAVAPVGPNRLIYDAQNNDDPRALPGKLARKEGQKPVADKDVNNIYDNSGYTWDFYNSQFRRNSIDGKGLNLIHSVHFGANYGNAFWEGTQMVYGDGDQVFKSFTTDIDITGHELTHGVVQYQANLEYVSQSGAINESMADVFGVMVRQLALKEDTTDPKNWLIGRTCMKGTGYALRSLSDPGSAYKNHPLLGDDPQPGHMKDYQNLPNTQNGDNGGVHINSGIPNHAFYLAAQGIGGDPWLKAGKIWYQALCDQTLLTSTSQFTDLVAATNTKAESIFGLNSPEATSVKKAWKSVGL